MNADSLELIILIILIISNILSWGFILFNKRKINLLNINRILTQLDQVEKNFTSKHTTLKEEVFLEITQLKEKIAILESHSSKNKELFKTVLNGFDFIVQGCKNAIEANPQPKSEISINKNVEEIDSANSPADFSSEEMEIGV